MRPQLYVGGAGTILKMDSGNTDDGVAIRVLAEPWTVAPGGIGGEAIFTTLYLVVSHNCAVDISITPILDGLELTDETEVLSFALPANGRRLVSRRELALGMDAADAETYARLALRGCWFSFRAEITAAPDGYVSLEGTEVEVEVVRESIKMEGLS